MSAEALLDEAPGAWKRFQAGFKTWRDCVVTPLVVFDTLHAEQSTRKMLTRCYGVWSAAFAIATAVQFINFRTLGTSFEGFFINIALSLYLFAGIAFLGLLYGLSLRLTGIRLRTRDTIAIFTVAMALIAPMTSIVMLPFMHKVVIAFADMARSRRYVDTGLALGALLYYGTKPTDIWSAIDGFARPFLQSVLLYGFFQIGRITAHAANVDKRLVYLSTARTVGLAVPFLYLGMSGSLILLFLSMRH